MIRGGSSSKTTHGSIYSRKIVYSLNQVISKTVVIEAVNHQMNQINIEIGIMDSDRYPQGKAMYEYY